jgi:WW domain
MNGIASTSNHNPAAFQGWTKSYDPNSGRYYYANHITRRTQWEIPDGWREEDDDRHGTSLPGSSTGSSSSTSRNPHSTTTTTTTVRSDDDKDDDEEPLPSNWEVMYDPSTGKPFYIDHERKITTWIRPKRDPSSSSMMSLRPATAASPSSGGNAAAFARVIQQQQQQSSTRIFLLSNPYDTFR